MTQVARPSVTDQPAVWTTISIGEEWKSKFEQFTRSAFRLEVLQAYAEPSESSPFNRYVRGEDPGIAWIKDWCDLVRSHQENNRTMQRVHLVDLPLSQYLKFEIQYAYQQTSEAGESIELLDRVDVGEKSDSFNEDFWLFDDSEVMVQDYTSAGSLYQARITSHPDMVSYYKKVRDEALSLSKPFQEFSIE